MTTITVKLSDSKAAILKDKAEKYGISLNTLVTASVEDLLSQPEPEFDIVMKKVLSKNKELYKRLA